MDRARKIGKKQVSKVCIIGGGNIGHYLIAAIGQNTDLRVNLLTSTPDAFRGYIQSINTVNGEITVGKLNKASSDPSQVIPDADMIIFTVPSHTYEQYLKTIRPFTAPGTIIGFIPGTGGAEFVAKDFVTKKKCMIFGTQRVPSGTKIAIRGKEVNSLGLRKDLRVGAIPSSITDDVCSVFNSLIGIKTIALPNYLSVTLTPSNPILHTSRLYGLFHDYKANFSYSQPLSFYKRWDDFSSRILLGCNQELQELCSRLDGFDLTWVVSLKDHYEVNTELDGGAIEQLTRKIRSLPFLKDQVPMLKVGDEKYKPDFGSRYFKEDFAYGLCIVKSFCEISRLETP